VELFFSTRDFQLKGQPYQNFPLVYDKSLCLVKPVFYFLVYHCITRGRVQSPRSWARYGQDMYDYFGWLEGNNLNWKDNSEYSGQSIVGRKLSIAAVADEASVSTAVHNRYPEIAEKVRQLLNKEGRRLKEAKGQELQAERAKRKKLYDENRVLRQKIAELVSRNASLEAELHHSRPVIEGNNINFIKPNVPDQHTLVNAND
jgi:hypothetical protein